MPAHPPDDWRRQGACLNVDPEIFFPIGNGEAVLPQVERAKKVCGTCRVTEDCLGWALEVGELEGIWGGLAPEERLPLLRRRRTAVS